MVLKPGNVVFVVHRRLYDRDSPRFFLGRVECYDSGVARVIGYSFGRDGVSGNFTRKSDVRTKLFGIASGTLLVYCLPDEMAIEAARFEQSEQGVCLVGSHGVSLNLSEWVHTH